MISIFIGTGEITLKGLHCGKFGGDVYIWNKRDRRRVDGQIPLHKRTAETRTILT